MFIFSGVFILVWGQPHIYKLLFCSIQKRGSSVVQGTLARIPPLGSGGLALVTPCGLRGGRNSLCTFFSALHPFSPATNFIPPFLHAHFIHFVPFYFISSCGAATCMDGRHPCYSQTFNIGDSLHLIPRTGPGVGYELRKVFVQECSPMGKFRSKIFAYG